MARKQDKKMTFGEFLTKYRKIIFLVLFFVVLPIVIVITLYSGVKSSGSRVTINEKDSIVVNTKKFIPLEEFEIFELTVDYYQRRDIKDTENENKLKGHNYSFKISYKKKSVPISNVRITPILKTPYHSYQVISSEKVLTEGKSQTVSFQYEQLFPVRPLAGINVKNPILYMQIIYHDDSSKQDLTTYVQYDISKAQDVIVN